VTDEFLTSLEIFPTLLAAAGSPLPDQRPLDGFDCLPVLRGEQPSSRTAMFWQRRRDRAARVGQWKWLEMGSKQGLYDLAADPGEEHDLSSENPAMLQRVKARWEEWRREMDAAEPRGPFRDY
jgi:arylsulfatase A-like enzyme